MGFLTSDAAIERDKAKRDELVKIRADVDVVTQNMIGNAVAYDVWYQSLGDVVGTGTLEEDQAEAAAGRTQTVADIVADFTALKTSNSDAYAWLHAELSAVVAALPTPE